MNSSPHHLHTTHLASARTAPATKTTYVCPMHPQIVRDAPGACPICGMALEPKTITSDEPANPELVAMSRRFWWSIAPTVIVVFLGMSGLAGRAVVRGSNWPSPPPSFSGGASRSPSEASPPSRTAA